MYTKVVFREDERWMNYSTGLLHTGKQIKRNIELLCAHHGTAPILNNCQGRCFISVPLRGGAEITYVRTR